MKKAINLAVSTAPRVGEILLFRAMRDYFNGKNGTTKSTFVREVHGARGFVEYDSQSAGIPVVKEIADLLIISFNQRARSTRACFLQAKFHRGTISPFLNFRGDYFQWELLSSRPDIRPYNRFPWPTDTLSFTTFKSISAFGIFFINQAKQYDMLYCIPEILKPQSIRSNKGRPYTILGFPGHSHCPNNSCKSQNTGKEAHVTCDLDTFENYLMNHQIGAPLVNTKLSAVVKYFLRLALDSNPTEAYLLEIIDSLGGVDLDFPQNSFSPNLLIVSNPGE